MVERKGRAMEIIFLGIIAFLYLSDIKHTLRKIEKLLKNEVQHGEK